MRIVSLVPHATELLFALGLGSDVVGVTHECDYPPQALKRPRVTRDVLPAGLSAPEIEAAVRERTPEGQASYELDRGALELLALDPKTLGETRGDVRTVAEATDRREAGIALVRDAASRIDRVKLAVRAQPRVRVAALEWLDPVYVAGHWTPQMIELAGGEDVLGLPGEHSEVVTWELLAAARPEVVVVMPCGYDAVRAHEEALAHRAHLARVGAARVVAVDASAYFSRPGPRLIDGLELLAHVLHPQQVVESPGEALTVDLSRAVAGG